MDFGRQAISGEALVKTLARVQLASSTAFVTEP